MFLLAILAGVFIALAGTASTIGSALLGKMAGALIFPAGLAMVVVMGSELFTGNNLMIIPALEKRLSVRRLLTAWLVVYLGNLAGSILIAAMTVWGGTFDSCYESLIATAAAKTALPFGTALLRGILCNVLVCTAVWMAMGASGPAGKIGALYLPIMVFVLCGFEHSVANMFYIPGGLFACIRYGVTEAGLTWGPFCGKTCSPSPWGI